MDFKKISQQQIAIFSIFLLLLLFSPIIFSNHLGKITIPDADYNSNLLEYTHLAIHMVKQFVTPHTNTLVIMERCEFLCEENRNYHKALLQNFIGNLNYTLSIQLFFGRPDFGKPEERPWDYNLFVIDSWWSFEALRFQVTTVHERQFYFFILLNMPKVLQSHANDHMVKIFTICLNYNVKNVVIMYRNPGTNYIGFYTYEIFKADHCNGPTTIQEVNRYENGTLQHELLFPDHMSNFNGCPLTMCGHLVEPLLMFDGDVHNKTHRMEMHRLGGSEGEIIKLVAKALNIKLQYMFPSELNAIGLFFNSTGCYKELEKNKAHVAVGAFTTSFANSYKFSHSYVYHTTPLVFVVRRGMSFGAIKQLLNPLKYETWLVMIACVMVMIVFTVTVEHVKAPTLRDFIFGPNNRHPLRNMVVVLLGNPVQAHVVPRRNFARFLLFAWLFFTFELRNGYQGKMFDSLRLGKRIPIPRKITELIDRDYTFLAAGYNSFYPHNKTIHMRNSTTRMSLVNRSEKRLTTAELLDFLIVFNIQNWNNTHLYFIEENVYLYQCVTAFKKHSILRPSFDRKFKLLSDAGITGYLSERQIHRYVQYMKSRAQSASVARITNHNLKGIYIIYGALCEISLVVFVMELLTRKSRKLKTLMDWLN